MTRKTDTDETRAAFGYGLMQAARIGGALAIIAAIAGTRDVLPLPFAAAVLLAIAGLISFFFAPTLIARRFASPKDDPS